VLEGARKNIGFIVGAMTGIEEPLKYGFINRGITTKESSRLLGVAVGGALGGIGGAMMGGAAGGMGSSSHSGELGVLVISKGRVCVSYFPAPFLSADGKISADHLDLFRKQLDSNRIQRKTFDIRRMQLSRSSDTVVTLGSGLDAFSFRTSDLYVNGVRFWSLPDATVIHDLLKELGALVTPAEFVAKLKRNENPIPEDQFCELENGDNYMEDVFNLILLDRHRSSLAENLPCLADSVRSALVSRFQDRGSSVKRAKIMVAICVAVVIAAVIGIAITADIVSDSDGGRALLCLSVLFGIAGLITGIFAIRKLLYYIWCRDAIKTQTVVH
jgi:hypothetical protein